MSVRARSGLLRVKKHDKAGREYLGQNEIVMSPGMFSAKEMERELQQAADESVEEVVGTEVNTYGNREAPEMESNPRRSTVTHTQWAGFRGSVWLPESPLVSNIESRREQDESPESG